MNISVTSDCFTSVQNPAPVLFQLAEAGFSHVMWCHHWNDDFLYTAPELRDIKRVLAEANLSLLDIHATHGQEKCCWSTEEYQREAGALLILNRLEMLQELEGTGVIVLHPPVIRAASDEAETALCRRQYEQFRKTMLEVLPSLEKYHAKIALENMIGDTWEILGKLLDELPPEYFGFCYDSGHAHLQVRQQYAEVEKYAGRIISVHLHDNDGSGDWHRTPGEGNIDWKRVKNLLDSSASYRGKIYNFELSAARSRFALPEVAPADWPEERKMAFLRDGFANCSAVAAGTKQF